LTTPDILFGAQDLGGNPFPFGITRSPNWLDLDALNGEVNLAGPGIIIPEVVINFNRVGQSEYNDDSSAAFMSEAGGIPQYNWGSFDGTTNEPVAYPVGTSIEELEARVLGGGN
jgi:hypothetical protein